MYKIGEFSILSKTTIKTLRYYEKEKLLLPCKIDSLTGYRYYDANQLVDLAKIVSLRQIGLSINEIKDVLNGNSYKDILLNRKKDISCQLETYENQLQKINYLLEDRVMNYEVISKELPEYTVYYKEGKVKNFGEIVQFILASGEECRATNSNIECILPDYCYISYLDGEYKEENFRIRYAQAVKEVGIPNETIKFEKLKPVNAVCMYVKGSYDNLPKAYSYIMKYIEENGYKIIEAPRERYIDGMWNKNSEQDWLTEIQVPVKKK